MIGCFIPTYNRPDLIRHALLNLASQQVKPDVVCVHQNTSHENYDYIIADLNLPYRVIWIFTERILHHDEWYSIPLDILIQEGCDYFFWMDHDDIHYANHIKQSITELQNADFRISIYSDLLTVDHKKYFMERNISFTVHACGGQSSSMAFNRAFAIEALSDIRNDNNKHDYTDQIIAWVTMPKFRCVNSLILSTCYVAHKGSYTSGEWVDSILNKL